MKFQDNKVTVVFLYFKALAKYHKDVSESILSEADRLKAKGIETFLICGEGNWQQKEGGIHGKMCLPELMLSDVSKVTGSRKSVMVTDFSEEELPQNLKNIPIIGLSGEKGYWGHAAFVVEEFADMDDLFLDMVYARHYKLPCVIFETARLYAREMCEKDLDEMFELYATLEGCPYIEPLYDYYEELEYTKKYIENMYGFFGHGLWLIYEKDTGQLVGRAGVELREHEGRTVHELGYLIRADRQGIGYGFEVCSGILSVAGDRLYLEEIYSFIDKDNYISKNLITKLGFVYVKSGEDNREVYKKLLNA